MGLSYLFLFTYVLVHSLRAYAIYCSGYGASCYNGVISGVCDWTINKCLFPCTSSSQCPGGYCGYLSGYNGDNCVGGGSTPVASPVASPVAAPTSSPCYTRYSCSCNGGLGGCYMDSTCSYCYSCASGTATTSTNAYLSCPSCSSNTYASGSGNYVCSSCPSNSYSYSGASTCTCNSGYVSSGSGGTLTCSVYIPPTPLPSSSPISPTLPPSTIPTRLPSLLPTILPTILPSCLPSIRPTVQPSCSPTFIPTQLPTAPPTRDPTVAPTISPTVVPPSTTPTRAPSIVPTITPTFLPSCVPSMQPTVCPTVQPSCNPTAIPTQLPTASPSIEPTVAQTISPTVPPSTIPTRAPSFLPTILPSCLPSIRPTVQPSCNPTAIPTQLPTASPTRAPTFTPTIMVTARPSISLSPTTCFPSAVPTDLPTTMAPTWQPTSFPTRTPIAIPSSQPSCSPSSSQPSSIPTSTPSCQFGYARDQDQAEEEGCRPCRRGTYFFHQHNEHAPLCKACPIGTISTTLSSLYCTACQYPYTTLTEGSTTCTGMNIHLPRVYAYMISSIIVFLFLVCIYIANNRWNILINLFFPTLDVLSDLLYLLTSTYAHPALFVFGIICTFGSLYSWIELLRQWKLYPKFYWPPFPIWWLAGEKVYDRIYYPKFPCFAYNNHRLPLLSNREHLLEGLILEGIAWVVALVCQLITLGIFIFALAANICFFSVWLVVGMILYYTKVIAIGKVWCIWFYLWTQEEMYWRELTSTTGEGILDVDTKLLNQTLLHEFLFETIPQVVIQLVNSALTKQLTNIGIFSFSISLYMALSGVWKYYYYQYVVEKSLKMEDIPIKFEVKVFFWTILDATILPERRSIIGRHQVGSLEMVNDTEMKRQQKREALHQLPLNKAPIDSSSIDEKEDLNHDEEELTKRNKLKCHIKEKFLQFSSSQYDDSSFPSNLHIELTPRRASWLADIAVEEMFQVNMAFANADNDPPRQERQETISLPQQFGSVMKSCSPSRSLHPSTSSKFKATIDGRYFSPSYPSPSHPPPPPAVSTTRKLFPQFPIFKHNDISLHDAFDSNLSVKPTTGAASGVNGSSFIRLPSASLFSLTQKPKVMPFHSLQ